MKLKNLSSEFVINDELLDSEWIGNLDSEQSCFSKLKSKSISTEFVLEFDEINTLVNNLPVNHSKAIIKDDETTTVKEFELVDSPFYLFESEEEILDLDLSFIQE